MKLGSFIERFGWNTSGDIQSIVWKRTDELENCLVIQLAIWPFWLPSNARTVSQPLWLTFQNVVEMRIEWSDLGYELQSLRVCEVSSANWCRSVPESLVSIELETDTGETRVICHDAIANVDEAPSSTTSL